MSYRLRNSEIAIFCAFTFYCLAWFVIRNVRDPLTDWKQATAQHPELNIVLTAIDGAGVLALLALVVAILPVLYAVLRYAWHESRRILGLLAVPPGALLVLIGYTLLARNTWTQKVNNNPSPGADLTPLAVITQAGFVILLLTAITGSLVAGVLAIKKSRLDERLLRLILFPAGVVTAGTALGLAGTIVLVGLLLAEAPQLVAVVPVAVSLVVMGLTTIFTGRAFWQGLRVQ